MGSLYKHGAQSINEFARFVFLEEVVEGRRVLLVEDRAPLTLGQGELPPLVDFLLSLGARKLVVAIADRDRLSALRDQDKRREVDYRYSRQGELPGDDGAFDLVVDFDLPHALARGDDYRLEDADRVLSDDGFALTSMQTDAHGISSLIADDQPGMPSLRYRDLAEKLNDSFDNVEVFFQSMLLGFFFGSYSQDAGEEGVAPQTALMGDEAEPAVSYLFAYGRAVPVVEEVSLVQLPFQEILARLGRGSDNALALETDTAEVQAELQDLRRENERRGLAINELAGRMPALKTEIDGLLSRLDQRTRERDQWMQRIGELEVELSEKGRAQHAQEDSERGEQAKLDEERVELASQLRKYQESFEKTGEALLTTQGELEHTKRELQKTKDALLRQSKDLISLEALEEDRNKERRESLARRSALETKLLETNSRVSELRTSLEDAQAAHAVADERAQRAQDELVEIREHAQLSLETVTLLEREGSESRELLALAQEEYATLQKSAREVERALTEAMASSSAYASEYERTQDELQAFQKRALLIEEEREHANELFALVERERDLLAATVSTLEDQIAQSEKAHALTRSELDEMSRAFEAQNQSLASLVMGAEQAQNDRDALKKELERSRQEQNQRLQAQRQEVETQRQEFERALLDAENEQSRSVAAESAQQQKLAKLAAGVHLLLEQRAQRKSKLASLMRNAELQKAKFDKAQDALESQSEAMLEAKEKSKALESEGAHIKAQLREMTREVSVRETKLKAQQELLEDLSAQRDTLQRVMKTKERETNAFESQLSEMQVEQSRLQEVIRAHEQKENQSDSMIRQLESDFLTALTRQDEVNQEISLLKKAREDAEEEVAQSQKAIASLNASHEGESQSMRTLSQENERLKRRMSSLEKELGAQEDLENELERVRQERFELDQEASKAEEKIRTLRTALDEADRVAIDLTQASQKVQTEIRSLREERDHAVEDQRAATLKLEHAQAQTRLTEDELHESRASVEHHQARARTLTEQLRVQSVAEQEREAAVASFQEALAEQEGQTAEAYKARDHARREVIRLLDEAAALESAWSDTEEELRAAQKNDHSDEMVALRARLTSLEKEKAELSERAEQKLRQGNETQTELTALEASLSHEQRRRSSLEESLETALQGLDGERDKRAQLERELEEHRQTLSEANARAQTLNAELSEAQEALLHEENARHRLSEALSASKESASDITQVQELLREKESLLSEIRSALTAEEDRRALLEATLAEAQVTVRFENAAKELGRAALDEARKAHETTVAEKEMMSASLEEAQQALAKENARNGYLTEVLEEAQSVERTTRDGANALGIELKDAQIRYRELSERYESVQEKREALQLELHRFETRGAELEQELETLSSQEGAPHPDTIAHEAMLRAEREEVRRLHEEVELQRTQASELEGLALSHERSLDRARGEIRQLRNRMIDLEAQAENAQKDAARLRQEKSLGTEEQTDATRLRSTISELEGQLSDREDRLRRLNMKLNNAGLL